MVLEFCNMCRAADVDQKTLFLQNKWYLQRVAKMVPNHILSFTGSSSVGLALNKRQEPHNASCISRPKEDNGRIDKEDCQKFRFRWQPNKK
jgi:hypothetical protein